MDITGKTMEVYVDDMLIKSIMEEDQMKHLEETFKVLDQHQMKLNPNKCAFGVTSGKFLGLMVPRRGIATNLKNIWALSEMKLPKTLHDVQILNGKIKILNYFFQGLRKVTN